MMIDKINWIYTEYIAKNKNFKFLCPTEIWQSDESSQFKTFKNYVLSSYYVRNKYIHGGVGIWSHSDLKVKPIILNQFCIDKDIEICGTSFTDSTGINHVILTCYRSPNGNLHIFCENIESILNNLWNPNNNIILAGDFNLDPVRDSKQYKSFKRSFDLFNLKNI